MAYDTNTARRMAEAALRTNQPRTELPMTTGIPFWDLMLSFGKASQQAMTSYGVAAGRPVPSEPVSYQQAQDVRHTASEIEVIPVGEETLHVGTRLISGETTRVRRVVVETPVEQAVSLREERVIVERRKPTGASVATATTQGILVDSVIEMSDSYEVVEVWKSARVTEEVVLRREVTERTETVRDTVRRDEVVVEQARAAAPALRQVAEVTKTASATMADPAKLSADLKKVAERFEENAQPNRAPGTPRPESNGMKAEPGPTARQEPSKVEPQKAEPQKAEAPKGAGDQPKVPAPGARPEMNAEQNDKSNPGRKN